MYIVYGDYSMVSERLRKFSIRYESIHNLVAKLPVGGMYHVVRCAPACLEGYRLAHTDQYVTILEEVYSSGHSKGGIDSDVVEFERMGVGGTLAAVRVALDELCLVYHVGGGYHHGMSSQPSGIDCCNDVAIALRYMLAGGLDRILYVDLDAHHPNGVQQILNNDHRVFQISLHQWIKNAMDGHFSFIGKGAGEGKIINMPLPPHTGDSIYLKVLRTLLLSVMRFYKPQAVFYQAGVDPHRLDPIGCLNLSLRGLYERDVLVKTLCMMGKIPRVIVLGGGYHEQVCPRAVVNTLAAFAEQKIVFDETCSLGAPVKNKVIRWYEQLRVHMQGFVELDRLD